MAKIYGNTTTTPIKPDLFGGEKITVDQTFNPESENAQSGKAVGEATEQAKSYTDKKVGDIETALDTIIEIQESLIGGVSV